MQQPIHMEAKQLKEEWLNHKDRLKMRSHIFLTEFSFFKDKFGDGIGGGGHDTESATSRKHGNCISQILSGLFSLI